MQNVELDSETRGPARPRVEAESADFAALAAERRRARRRLVWGRKMGAAALLIAPMLAVVVTDALRRGDRLAELHGVYRATYAGAMFESLVLWSVLLVAASRRNGWGRWVAAVLFVIAATFAYGGQQYFFQQYNAYLNVDVSLFASNFMDSVVNQLLADIGNYLRAKTPPFLVAILLVVAGRRLIRPRRWVGRTACVAAPVLLIASFFIPTQHRHLQASTPDVLYLQAVGGLIRTQLGFTDQSHQLRPRVRNSLPVGKITTDKPNRNVVFVLLESVRADATCIAHDESCRRTEATNQLFPGRYPFTQMRSMESTTAISLAVLWSGVGPQEPREVLHTWPLLFDYAKSAGFSTAYWTSQNMMFGNARLWVKNLGADRFVSATDLAPTADLDMGAPENHLADYVVKDFDELPEPFFAVVHLSNVHYPYYVNPKGPKPFQPATTSKAPDQNGSFFNYYQNSVYQQDQHIARILRHIRESDAGKRTIVVYTSDHGEAFREHGQMGHTFSIFDEEIHVPAWIDAPPGVFTPDEEKNLRAKRDAFLFHVDMAPTMLDLMGLWDSPQVDKYKSKMLGHSMLRPELTETALPMTNCGGVWSCAFENWGYMRRNMKIEARAWDTGWKCYDVERDPFETTDLGVAACGDLLDRTIKTFGGLPGRTHD